jgi:tryptophan synthase alpha chain
MSATTSSDVLSARFAELRRRGRKALVVYVTAGHPSPNASLELLRAIAAAGADVIEIGVPFSDPMADGPVIQRSSQQALQAGMTVDGALDLVRQAQLAIPVVLFSYLNPLLAAGPDVLERASQAGVHGVLVTDLPLGADAQHERWFGESPLAFVRLVAPTTPSERMRDIGAHGSGFVYLISRTGVTGAQDTLSADLPATVRRLRAVTNLPICVGFGISTPEQAREVAHLADGVVVGSALVAEAEHSVARAAELVRRLRMALDT